MALPKDLKSDMTGMPVFEPESEAAETVVPQANDTEAIPMAEPFLPTAVSYTHLTLPTKA